MSIMLCLLKRLHCFHLIIFFQVVLSPWMKGPKKKVGGGAGFLPLHLSFSVEVVYVDVLSLNNLQFSRLRSWGRKMDILKAALYECSCYSRVIWTFVNSRCWERLGGCLWGRQEVRVSWESQRRQGEEAPQIWLSVNANVATDKNKEPAQSFGVAGGKTSSHTADRDGRKEPACWQSRPSTVGLLFQVSISSSLVGRY